MELKNFLNNEKITVTKLAEKLGIKKQTVCSQIKYWENGGQPTLKTIALWSETLEISQEKFIQLISK